MSERIECKTEGCDAQILASTAERTGGLCAPCVKKQEKPLVPPRVASVLWKVGAGLALAALVLAAGILLYEMGSAGAEVAQEALLPGRVEAEGREAEAVLWELKTEESKGCRPGYKKSYERCYLNVHPMARFVPEEGRVIEVELETEDDPLLALLTPGQPVPIRYLPEDPWKFVVVAEYAPETLSTLTQDLEQRPSLEEAVVVVEPIVFGADDLRGFALVQVSRKFLEHPWADEPRVASLLRAHGAKGWKSCTAFVGPGRAGRIGSVEARATSSVPAEERDPVAAVNRVKVGDPLELQLDCRVQRGSSESGVKIAFPPRVLGKEASTLRPEEMASVSFVSNP